MAAVLLLLAAFLAIVPAAGAANQPSSTIDFTQAGEGPFDGSYFSQAGFNEGSWVGYVQGDEALIGPAAGTAADKFTSISAQIAPAVQGTAVYTLEALGSNGTVLHSSSLTLTQDTGDPETSPWGYAKVELQGVPKKARSFRISNRFVRSSFAHTTQIEFGVAEISWAR
jgi:hypothetical protein